jgi:hypothetical protein
VKGIPDDLLKTEDAVETLGGLLDILRCVHDVAGDRGTCALHNQVGYLLNVLDEKISAARHAYQGGYARYWRDQARLALQGRRRRRARRNRNAR